MAMLVSTAVQPKLRPAAQKHSVNTAYFDVLTPAAAYWLGFILADGCVSLRKRRNTHQAVFSLSSKDAEHLEQFRLDADCTYPLTGPYNGTWHLIVTSWPLCLSLERQNIVPQKSKIAQIPTVPAELRRHVFRGIVDGDGCFNRYYQKRKNGCRYAVLTLCVVGSEFVCNDFKTQFGGGCVARKAGVWQYSCTGRRAEAALLWMYDTPGPVLSRKRHKLVELGVLNG